MECTFIDIGAIKQKKKTPKKTKPKKQNTNYSRAVKCKVGCVYAINMERCLDSRCLNWNFLVVSFTCYKTSQDPSLKHWVLMYLLWYLRYAHHNFSLNQCFQPS